MPFLTRPSSLLPAALLAGVLAGCQAAPRDEALALPEPRVEAQELTCLGDSLEAFREQFNASEDKPRLVILLCPDSTPCELGSRAVRQSVLDAYPDTDLRAFVVWVDTRVDSSLEEARHLAGGLADPRVEQFHDPLRRAGRTFAERLLPTSLAWDVYLFYPPGARWEERPPVPVYWSHQRGRIEPEHFHPRERLFDELHRAMGSLAAAGEGRETGGGGEVALASP